MDLIHLDIPETCPNGKGEVVITVYGFNPPGSTGYKTHHSECDSNDFWTDCQDNCPLVEKYNHFIF